MSKKIKKLLKELSSLILNDENFKALKKIEEFEDE